MRRCSESEDKGGGEHEPGLDRRHRTSSADPTPPGRLERLIVAIAPDGKSSTEKRENYPRQERVRFRKRAYDRVWDAFGQADRRSGRVPDGFGQRR